jgi:alpha-tubulin suppressor-like RCC1 family protein
VASDSAWLGMTGSSGGTGAFGFAHDPQHFHLPAKINGLAGLTRPPVEHPHPQQPGLGDQGVLQLAACGGVSLALAAGGTPWAFGGAGNRASPAWGHLPRPAAAAVAATLDRLGGAVQVAAGATFCAALTASGQVVLWGPGADGAGLHEMIGSPDGGPSVAIRSEQDACIVEFLGLPALTSLAAGVGHLVMTNGRSVWAAEVPAGGLAAPWQPPRLVLDLGNDDGVASVQAGGFASAAVSGSGRLWLWGTVLSPTAAAALLARSAAEGHGHWAYSASAAEAPALAEAEGAAWAGLGAEQPALVPGLHGVRRVALGVHHVLAEVA